MSFVCFSFPLWPDLHHRSSCNYIIDTGCTYLNLVFSFFLPSFFASLPLSQLPQMPWSAVPQLPQGWIECECSLQLLTHLQMAFLYFSQVCFIHCFLQRKHLGHFLPKYPGIPLFNCLRLKFAFKQQQKNIHAILERYFFFLLQALIN